MGVVDAIRWAERTITFDEAAGEVTRAEAELVVAVAREQGFTEPQIRSAFVETGHRALFERLPAPSPAPMTPVSSPAARLLRLRESLECNERFEHAVRSATRVIEGFVSRWSPDEYAALPPSARLAFWQAVLIANARAPARLFEVWTPFAPETAALARRDLLAARDGLRRVDTRWPSDGEISVTADDLVRRHDAALAAEAARRDGDPCPDAPSRAELDLFTRLSAEAAWSARVGSQDRGDVVAWAVSPIIPQVFGDSPVPARSSRRAVMETGARTAAWVGGDATVYPLLALNICRGIILGSEAYDRTSPDYETRYGAYLRDVVRVEADGDVEEETRLFRRLAATAERLEQIRQWRLRHPDAVVDATPAITAAP